MDFTANWGWPQWAFVIWFLLRLALFAAQHGNERLIGTGPLKGQPERYNFFVCLVSSGILIFALTAGGFFA